MWRFSKPVVMLLVLTFMLPPASPQQTSRKPPLTVESPTKQPTQPSPEELAATAVDKFLKGVKLAGLSEGKAMLAETQWITGDADYGANFYSRPVYTDSKTLYEGMFDTDVPGVRGYKRLMEMDAVSEAKTPLKIRFIAIAYADKTSAQWKVLGTGTDDSVDIERNLAFFENHLTNTEYTSQQDNYLNYGHWLLKAGRVKAAKQALRRARDANPFSATDPHGTIGGTYVPLHRAQIAALLEVINRIAGI